MQNEVSHEKYRKNMISQKTQLETKVQDQDHTYLCPTNASLVQCFEALNVFRSYIYGRIKEAEDQKILEQETPKTE